MYRIVGKKEIAFNTTLFEVEAPEVARKALAGQFVVVRLDERGERIPLTIADFDRGKGTITMVVLSVGKTTKKLSRLREGDHILDVAGPLGNPAEMVENSLVVCIGGGLGIAPIYPIARELKARGNKVISIIGARSASLLFWEDRMREVSDELYVVTDDGSYGRKGFAVHQLLDLISSGMRIDRVIIIGSAIMMKVTSEATRPYGIKTIVSLNPIMVDGTGMCGSCRVTVGGKTRFACVDGPEFDGHEVDFDELLARLRMYSAEERLADELYMQGVGACQSCQKNL
ncbi:sulfide dehydrogenase (flavoprotein) subunit SudB [Methanocella conradii HZ254]|uniref:Sulfide dehydrogenase (Flavoprotein) subunit SudB n=1 Tax=Methanocella conradii (strain DSM 24694 / JCM 17849 / CGMCC 1.5162 / HZ254) TaxID=1041930 RepID=H8I7M7_METCZ|nr:sulfide/dihydroorotate dehydrogenase-like FAD/NAD-binding protein [Methanocella conradii]AFC99862.1 sulfide dehydrogenase (flavoprotein) subunit SudB [Methanocella conradii HZ254]MDI6896419.1 sulfide/dihydroorotate dehydrogenase-like FAD/NAD-binding protein [Methanocella conradii]